MSTTLLTPWNYRELEHEGETNTLPSQTQPDEVLSIREMITRHSRGLPIYGDNGQYYDDDSTDDGMYIPDPKTLDLSELQDYAEHYRSTSQKLEQELLLRNNPPSAEGDRPQMSDGQPNSDSDPEP